MKWCIIFLLFSTNTFLGYSQDTIKKYYNGNWIEVPNRSLAVYYRNAYKDSNKLFSVHDYFLSGKIQMTGTYKTKSFNVKQGHYVYYYENGNKESEGNYIDDKRDGVWLFWFENGRKMSNGVFRNDSKEHKWVYWFDNGKENSEGSYLEGVREGLWVYWFETGDKKSEGRYIHDNYENLWKFYYLSGKIETEELYKNGVIISAIGFFENGKQKYKGLYKNEKKYGEWNYWNVDGRLMLKGIYSNDLCDGEWTRYFKNGDSMKVMYNKGKFVNNNIVGSIIRIEANK